MKLSNFEKQQLPFEDKVKLKAQQLSHNMPVLLGKSGTTMMIDMINEALDGECPYCGRMLVLGNISIDHKQPVIRARVKRGLYSPEELTELNSRRNLHIICLDCNKIKREIPHDKFIKLLNFLNEDEELKKQIWNRLSSSNVTWMMSRFKKKARQA